MTLHASALLWALTVMSLQRARFAAGLLLDLQQVQSLQWSESAAQRHAALGLQPAAPHLAPNPATFAVIARVFWGEIPYIKSFIAHYSKIGVERIVLVATNDNDSDMITNYLKRIGFDQGVESFTVGRSSLRSPLYHASIDVFLHDQSHNRGPDPFVYSWGKLYWSKLNMTDVQITQDYVIAVDADEYLAPAEGNKSLADMVAPFPDADLFLFGWVVAPYDGEQASRDPNYFVYEDAHEKYMIRTDKLLELGDEAAGTSHMPHRTSCDPNCTIQQMGHRLVHFSYRGLWDAVFRDVAEAHFKSEQGGIRGVRDKTGAFEPTLRQKLMAFSCLMAEREGVLLDMGPWTPELSIDKAAVAALLPAHMVDSNMVRVIPEIYSQFKRVMNYSDVWNSTFARLTTLTPGEMSGALRETTTKKLVASHLDFVKSSNYDG